jgi:predicted SAM-dependent methyltransferase
LIGLAFASQPDASYSLFEPSWPLQDARVKLANLPKIGFHDRTNEFEASMFSKISCLEVLEHVTPTSDLPVVLRDIFRLLRPGGLLVVSMPIEFGPVSLLKNTFRVVTKTTFHGTSARTIFLSAIGLASRINREEGHMGFDYRSIRGLLVETGFQLEKTRFTPLSVGGPLCNSQVIYRLRKPL